jgi:hypothetical protein
LFDYAGKFPYFGANFSCRIYCDPVSEIYKKFNFLRIDYVFFLQLNDVYDFNGYKPKAIYDNSIKEDIDFLEKYFIPLLDMGRSATNVVGNSVATAVVSKWENALENPDSGD